MEGNSANIGDEFTFSAGGGMHYSKQRLTELVPNQKIVWQVIESNLSFLQDPTEWNGTKISFDVSEQEGKSLVSFTHEGLIPEIECYESCSGAWGQYLDQYLSPIKSVPK